MDALNVRSVNFRYRSVFDVIFLASRAQATRDLFCTTLLPEVDTRLDTNCGKRDFCFVTTTGTAVVRLEEAGRALFCPEAEPEKGRQRSSLIILAHFGFTKPVSSFGFTVFFKLVVAFG